MLHFVPESAYLKKIIMQEFHIEDPSWTNSVKKVHREHQQFVLGCSRAPNIVSWYNDRLNMVIDLIQVHRPNAKNLLDIGCAQGTIAIRAAEHGYAVTANDIREEYLSYARLRDNLKKVNFIRGNFLNYHPENKFDVIIFTEVIEHIVDHDKFLSHIFNCLNPGGVLIVTTPNHGFVRQPLPSYNEVNMSENLDKEFSGDGSDHFYLFTKQELISILEKQKFMVLSHIYWLSFLEYGSFKTRWLWLIFPSFVLRYISALFKNNNKLCAQHCIVARR